MGIAYSSFKPSVYRILWELEVEKNTISNFRILEYDSSILVLINRDVDSILLKVIKVFWWPLIYGIFAAKYHYTYVRKFIQ